MNKDEKLNPDTQDRLSLNNPMYTNDFTILRRSPVALKNDKTQNTLLSLKSLKKTVLGLRNSLDYKRKNTISRSNIY